MVADAEVSEEHRIGAAAPWYNQPMRKLTVCLLGISLIGSPVAAETLGDWAITFLKPETQRKVLDRIFPDQIGAVSDAVLDKQNGTYFFTKNSSFVRLGKDFVWNPAGSPYLIVTCMLYRAMDQEPTVATSYIFRDTQQRPATLTAGYATHERVRLVKLPKLDKSFLLVEDSVANPQGEMRQWTAFLLEVDSKGLSDHPRNVWTSSPQFHSFQMGFTDLDGKTEDLVVRTVPSPQPKKYDYGYDNSETQANATDNSQYAAYHWTGDHFEADTTVFDSRLKALPDSVWQYGTGR
jgi:hypothetical protein